MFGEMNSQKKYSLSLLALVMGGMLCACSDKMAGTSEETEGIVAIADKEIAGVSQKGPFVTGSSIILKETSSDGSLKPTGKEFYATTRSNKGDFKISKSVLASNARVVLYTFPAPSISIMFSFQFVMEPAR